MSRWSSLREQLKLAGAPADRSEAIAELTRPQVVEVVGLKAGGSELSKATRDELLGKLRSGENVELELEVLAYEQKPGVRNRASVRVRDGAMLAFGRSGKGKPFLRDHLQGNSLARAGTILDSSTEKRGDGDYVVRQRIQLSAPWAVELALLGLIGSLSVGIAPGDGDVLCSVCGTPVFEDCYHFRGEEVQVDGSPVVVEWIYEKPEIDETSLCNVPAVATARVEAIRAVLSAGSGQKSGFRAVSAQGEDMKFSQALAAILSLAATAGEDEILEAVKRTKQDRDSLEARLSVATADCTRLSGIVEQHRQSEQKHAAGEFTRVALSEGKIAPADVELWQKLFAIDEQAARADMAKRAVGCATPVGSPRQTPEKEPAPAPAPAGGAPSVDLTSTLQANGADPTIALSLAKAFGAKNPEKSIPQALGLSKEA